MKKILFLVTAVAITLTATSSFAGYNPYANPNRVNVQGYYRSNGTYVQPHQRTAPNGIKSDNLNFRL